ncbi:hypothetical protein [Dawidia soli]|uniref:Uncharacterized protein n=1 Tax=Dawidia soli TaxID=2782352 RepID=A0AAP2GFJ9_9BACT|nr:hypothetical protein [Dawidia soli]MBT1689524.1 hypothetical protein [Dawidia soli]
MKTIYRRPVITLLAICFILVASSMLRAQTITSLDSTYLAYLTAFSKNARSLASEVWPGMTIGPFCIYRVNGPAYNTLSYTQLTLPTKFAV